MQNNNEMSQFEGSGPKDMIINQEAMNKVDETIEALKIRAESGEDVDNEIRSQLTLKRKLEEDKSRIAEGGMS